MGVFKCAGFGTGAPGLKTILPPPGYVKTLEPSGSFETETPDCPKPIVATTSAAGKPNVPRTALSFTSKLAFANNSLGFQL
jgi:hypothetical protein